MNSPPKYQLMPEMAPEDYEALKADIAANGMLVPIDVDEDGNILDGHHRDRAWKELCKNEPPPTIVHSGLSEEERRTFARKVNLLRRHLTREQRRALIEDELREGASRSNRQIAAELGVDHKTVASTRDALQATGEIPQLDKTTGADGKARPARQPGASRRRKRAPREDDAWDDGRDDWDDPVKTAKLHHAVDIMRMGADPNGEKVVKLLEEASAFRIESKGYDRFAHCDEAGKHDWCAFILFLVRQCRWDLEGASAHIEYVLQKQFKDPAEWLGDEGTKWRRIWGFPKPQAPAEQFMTDWAAFLAKQANRTTADIEAELNAIAAEDAAANAKQHKPIAAKANARRRTA